MAGRFQVIIDSSVAVKWFSNEEKTPEAVELRDQHIEGRARLFTTSLLACELANALRYKPDFDRNKLAQAMIFFFKLHLPEIPIDNQLMTRAADVAFKGNVTIYDAVPVAAALVKKLECITADKDTQYAKLKPKGYPIILL